MIYLFQRVVQNHFQWTRPSPGRLGPSGEGDYVKSNGFGFEDWNFNKNLLIDGYIYGHLPHPLPKEKRDEKIKIVFATYINQQWYLVGFYIDCEFVTDPPVDTDVIEQKIQDLKQLGPSLGNAYRKLKRSRFVRKMKDDAQLLKWRVSPNNVVRTNQPIPIPKKIFNTQNYRMGRATILTQTAFDALYSLAKAEDDVLIDYGDDGEFPEGREVERIHRARERNQALVRRAKEKFKQKYGHLYCQICRFDFSLKYGDIGSDFIEAHHTAEPISSGEMRTKVKDIAMVCSNCHRMLHRRRPWLKMKQLKKLIAQNA